MNASSVDIMNTLDADASLSLTSGTNLFASVEPDLPDESVTVLDTPGAPPMIALNEFDFYNPSIQVRVRSNDYQTGWTLAEQILESLHGRANFVVGSVKYVLVYCSSGPFPLGQDNKNRYIFVVNFNVQRTNV